MSETMGIRVDNLTKIFLGADKKPFKAVDNVSLAIQKGKFITLLGPSGCGKTTVLRMIAGFDYPTEGNIYLGDECINELPPDKRETAMVFQSYALFPHCDVFDNVAYGLKLKKCPKNEMNNKVNNMLELVGLEGLGERYPNQISGGQQQRVALARALVLEPKVLLFDEPLSNLDAKLRVYMRTEIRKIQQRFGITAVYVTHDQAEAMSISDEIIIMNKGIVEQVGTPEEVYYRPANEFVADFIGIANFLEGYIIEKVEGKVQVETCGVRYIIDGSTNKKAGEKCKVMLRPETIKIGESGAIKGKVVLSVFMGAYQEYHLKVGEDVLQVQDYNPKVKRVFKEGEVVGIDLPIENIHIV